MKTVTEKKLDKYFDLTAKALKKIKFAKKLTKQQEAWAKECLDFAQNYFSDAKYFRAKGDWVTSFAAVTYAHAWLDAGARFGWFDVGGDSELFVVDK